VIKIIVKSIFSCKTLSNSRISIFTEASNILTLSSQIKIFGFNSVSIFTNNEVAFSDKALYNKDSGICKLFGNVKLQKGDSFLTGDYAEVDLNKGISKLLPAPNLDKLNENRVRALIDKKQKFEE